MDPNMGFPPSSSAIHEAKMRTRSTDVIVSSCLAGAPANAAAKTTLLVDVHSPQSLSRYLESSAPPTPLLTISNNSSLTSFFNSGSSRPVNESLDNSCLVALPASHMAEDTNPPATNPENRERTHSVNSLQSGSPIVFSHDEGIFASPFASPISTIDLLEGLDSREYDLEEGLFGDAMGIQIPRVKNTIPVDTPLSTSFSSKFSHFPSFAKKWKGRKDSVTVTINPLDTIPTTTRSHSSNDVREDKISPISSPKHTSFTEVNSPVSPLDLENLWSGISDPIDRTRFTSTPLLPPNLHAFDEGEESDARIHSPFLSSAIGSSRALSVASETSESSGLAILDVQSTSFAERVYSQAPVSRQNTTQSDAPDLSSLQVPVKKQDEWSTKLGHFNFTIDPEPYIPEEFTAESYEILHSDWEIARTEYCKHKARTLEHYGPNSKAFKLTEEKWACIDSQWQSNSKEVREKALENGEILPEQSDETTGKVLINTAATISSVNIPLLDGKFPKLGDADIVGPMAMDPPKPGSRAVSPTRGLQQVTGWKLAKFFGRV